jgi:hypothetical protein
MTVAKAVLKVSFAKPQSFLLKPSEYQVWMSGWSHSGLIQHSAISSSPGHGSPHFAILHVITKHNKHIREAQGLEARAVMLVLQLEQGWAILTTFKDLN